jgi:FlaA1/EpsC-like NDP-sugar epimerase
MLKVNGKAKHLAMAVVDAVLILSAVALGLYLRFDMKVPSLWLDNLETLLIPAVLINLIIFYLFGFYRRVWRYAGVDELLLIAVAVTAGSGGIYLYSLYSGMLPRSSYVITWFLLLFFIGGFRLSVRLLSTYLNRPLGGGKKKKVLIVGAGEAGVLVARELKRHGDSLQMKLVGYLDDDPGKQRQIIQGLPVIGRLQALPDVVVQRGVAEVVIAMPSAPYSTLQEIVGLCADLQVKIKTVPGIFEILKGQVSINSLKEVEIEDLLRRPPVTVDLQAMAGYLEGEVVMVTGAGGSIGGELCRQIAGLKPQKLILADHDENGIFYIHNELTREFRDLDLLPLVVDIKERDALKKWFVLLRPTALFHAAAHKHVPLMEINTEEAVRNNIEGSKNVIDLASRYGVKRFVFISTDKAVNPSSVMGSTKRVVEIYLQQKARNCSSCVYCAVRFGNVLGSQGSVVEIFKRQIVAGGPVTVTDPEMKRYFMTIPEAVQLVIQAGALGRGGEIFVLDMGEPVKIVDLARDMIILSGLKPERDIKLEFTGLRPGEKLYEELFSDRENFNVTRHERIFIAPDSTFNEAEIQEELGRLGKRLGLGKGLTDLLWAEERE